MTKDMTEGNIWKHLFSFAIPLLLGNLFQQTYNMIDTAIVGQYLGEEKLASVGASSSVQFLYGNLLWFCNSGIPTFWCKKYSENERSHFSCRLSLNTFRNDYNNCLCYSLSKHITYSVYS